MTMAARAQKRQQPAESQHSHQEQNALPGADAVRIARMERLLRLEGEIRRLPDVNALRIFAVNELKTLLPFVQGFFVELDEGGRRGRKKARVLAATGLSVIDRQAPLIAMMEAAAGRAAAEAGLSARMGRLEAWLDGPVMEEWAFREALWLPLIPPHAPEGDGTETNDTEGKTPSSARSEPRAGLLLLRAEPFTEADAAIGMRLAEALGQAHALLSPRKAWLAFWRKPRVLIAVATLVALLMLVPVPMTVMAPAEVVAADPLVVAAPMDGVIREVVVDPGAQVMRGTLLAVYDDTRLKADAELAARKVAVAASRVETLRKAAFDDPRARAELAQAQAELDLALAEQARAQELLSKVELRAAQAGIAVFSDRREWVRRPVSTGEKIMEIADPHQLALRIDVPVKDAIAIRPGARVRVFLDADPLHAIPARVTDAGYHAREVAGGVLAYRVMARFEPEADAAGDGEKAPTKRNAAQKALRIGFRGTAQISGETVPLGFYLFRRPIAALRQYFGF